MADRLDIKWNAIFGLLKNPGVAARTEEVARKIDATASRDTDTKFDSQMGDKRFRAAVIGGYEHGATAEHTRATLLRALDGAG